MRFFLTLVLLLALAAATAYFLLVQPFGPSQARMVTVPSGASVDSIARTLRQNGIIRSQYAFDLAARLQHGTLKAGVYRFDHPAPLLTVYQRLRDGDVYTIALTVPEGYNIFDIAAAVEHAGLASKNTFLAAEMQDTALIRDIDPHAPSLEGYLFPDTYKVAPNATPDEILARMVAHFRKEAKALGLTTNIPATVTLASLVERETPVAGDRPMVASVFTNRLAKSMPLDTDPSVIYAALLEKRYRGTIYASDLKAESPYNTYLHAGLPPGPICNPGIPSIEAAMHPAASDYLYFVSDPANPGHSRFAATLEEHEKNVAAYRKGQRPGNGR